MSMPCYTSTEHGRQGGWGRATGTAESHIDAGARPHRPHASAACRGRRGSWRITNDLDSRLRHKRHYSRALDANSSPPDPASRSQAGSQTPVPPGHRSSSEATIAGAESPRDLCAHPDVSLHSGRSKPVRLSWHSALRRAVDVLFGNVIAASVWLSHHHLDPARRPHPLWEAASPKAGRTDFR